MFQIRMIANNQRYFNIPLSCRITRQHVKQAMRHLRYKNSHTRLVIREIQPETHAVFLCIQRIDIFINLLFRNEEVLQFPLDPHKENILDMIYILIEIYNIPFIYGYEVRHIS